MDGLDVHCEVNRLIQQGIQQYDRELRRRARGGRPGIDEATERLRNFATYLREVSSRTSELAGFLNKWCDEVEAKGPE